MHEREVRFYETVLPPLGIPKPSEPGRTSATPPAPAFGEIFGDGNPPISPYPPDLPEDPPPTVGLADLADAVAIDRCELRRARLANARLRRVELRGCDLTGLDGADALRGARMPWSDVLENAPLFATALGLEIVD